jgi:CBS domain-containing protein
MSNELQVNTYFESSQDSPVIASFSDGSFIVAWESYNQDGSGNGIYAQHYNVDGIPVVDDEGKLVGVVTKTDIVRELARTARLRIERGITVKIEKKPEAKQ